MSEIGGFTFSPRMRKPEKPLPMSACARVSTPGEDEAVEVHYSDTSSAPVGINRKSVSVCSPQGQSASVSLSSVAWVPVPDTSASRGMNGIWEMASFPGANCSPDWCTFSARPPLPGAEAKTITEVSFVIRSFAAQQQPIWELWLCVRIFNFSYYRGQKQFYYTIYYYSIIHPLIHFQ